jgi:L-fuconate dehydratase
MEKKATILKDVLVQDIRFPTSLDKKGSDASHPDPDYSATYVTIVTDVPGVTGFGQTYTIGRGNELVVHAVDSLRFLVVNSNIQEIQGNTH